MKDGGCRVIGSLPTETLTSLLSFCISGGERKRKPRGQPQINKCHACLFNKYIFASGGFVDFDGARAGPVFFLLLKWRSGGRRQPIPHVTPRRRHFRICWSKSYEEKPNPRSTQDEKWQGEREKHLKTESRERNYPSRTLTGRTG